jgi:hypothetical protein
MATFPNHLQLRRHALPAFIAAGLDRELDRRAAPRRPRLIATRHIGSDGRPACGWSATRAAGTGFTLDPPSG